MHGQWALLRTNAQGHLRSFFVGSHVEREADLFKELEVIEQDEASECATGASAEAGIGWESAAGKRTEAVTVNCYERLSPPQHSFLEKIITFRLCY